MISQSEINPVALILQTRGATSGSVLARELNVSQPTLSRRLAALGSSVERIGARRSSRYALRRDVRNLGSSWPIYRMIESGQASLWGELRSLHGGFRALLRPSAVSSWLETLYPDQLYPGLPFFIQDVRPQGYIGRAIGRRAGPLLGVSTDVRDWSDDDVLAYMLAEGDDLLGDLILGEHALERALRRMDTAEAGAIESRDRAAAFPLRAEAAQRGDQVGSSAGGEQPKFLALVRRPGGISNVLVKFSSADRSPVQRRWMDLLVSEHLAAELLAQRHVPGARTEIVDGGGRRFLEVERFDRVHAFGRRGLLTLGSLEDGALDATSPDWLGASKVLEAAGLLRPKDARRLRWVACFGDLIGNSDMHRGNASFLFGAPPFVPTPAYDMLPMLHAPGAQGELASREFSPRPPMPGVADVWPDAAAAAVEFWARVESDPRISADYRRIAESCGARVAVLQARLG